MSTTRPFAHARHWMQLLALQLQLQGQMQVWVRLNETQCRLDERGCTLCAAAQQVKGGPALARVRARYRQVCFALTRLECGEYGWCEHCGEEIAPAQLVAAPEVSRCTACQAKGAQ